MSRILLIDDDAQMGEPLAAYFRRFDFELSQATRPGEGLALLRRGGFDAVILDVMLPEQDGFAVLRGHEADLVTRAVDIVVSRLRRKLEPLAAIKTLRNAGYALALRPRGHG